MWWIIIYLRYIYVIYWYFVMVGYLLLIFKVYIVNLKLVNCGNSWILLIFDNEIYVFLMC